MLKQGPDCRTCNDAGVVSTRKSDWAQHAPLMTCAECGYTTVGKKIVEVVKEVKSAEVIQSR